MAVMTPRYITLLLGAVLQPQLDTSTLIHNSCSWNQYKMILNQKAAYNKISSKIYLGNKDVLVLCILSNTWYILVSEGLGG